MKDFLYEADILHQLKGAGGAPLLYLVGTDSPLILMQFCPFPSLSDILFGREPLSQCEALSIFEATARALQQVHEAGFVHCDIKPDNLLVDTSTGSTKVSVIDFGISSAIGHSPNSILTTTDPANYGYSPYISPELWAGDPVTPASDVFALGFLMKLVLKFVQDRRQDTVDPLVADLCETMGEPDPTLRPAMPQVAAKILSRLSVLKEEEGTHEDGTYDTMEWITEYEEETD